MKKSIRILAMLLMVVLAFSTMMPAYAQSVEPIEMRSEIKADCYLRKTSNTTCILGGSFKYITSAEISVVVKLYSSNGTLLASSSKTTTGLTVTTGKTVTISSGTYLLSVVGYANGVVVCQKDKTVSIP